ncbi:MULTISPECIES: hypothetical protein [Protofrankia]|uniref:Helix-turn-helix domain-containing protein n=1 Tax=Protofrankia coriariae TaxID=1562887 RepID=A0ABR5F497_9ACTN|nr:MULTISPECIES: hypothetical protein [Protofrankia]KLL11552.1 hypothetical protein FrCorBMG51_10960 [Protofrankia coriariae]ONH35685.1 hypothetical protein BL254_10355 [Protofrankia sp. BMG5.30]
MTRPLEEIPARQLRAALTWADARARAAGERGFSAGLITDRLQTSRYQAGGWLRALVTAGVLDQVRTDMGLAYRLRSGAAS